MAFAASNSKKSINKKLVAYAAGLLPDADVEVFDMNDFELPLYSQDLEEEFGQPPLVAAFLSKISETDVLIISFAEHNGSFTSAFKNLFDWCTRFNRKVFQEKPLVILATSPGGRGGANVLAEANSILPRFGGNIKASIGVPSFSDNFDNDLGVISNSEINQQLIEAMQLLVSSD